LFTYKKEKEDYGKIMDILFPYTVSGKNRHDNFPEGMAMLSEYAQSLVSNKMEIFKKFL